MACIHVKDKLRESVSGELILQFLIEFKPRERTCAKVKKKEDLFLQKQPLPFAHASIKTFAENALHRVFFYIFFQEDATRGHMWLKLKFSFD